MPPWSASKPHGQAETVPSRNRKHTIETKVLERMVESVAGVNEQGVIGCERSLVDSPALDVPGADAAI